MRNVFILMSLLAALTAGCEPNGFNSAGNAPPHPTPTPPPTQTIMAVVNGEPIYTRELTDILIGKFGMDYARELIAEKVVEQEAERLGITVDEQDIRAEDDYFLDLIEKHSGSASSDLEANPQQLLEQVLADRGMTRADYERLLRREALLRKMLNDEVKVSEEDIQAEFDRQYGRKVQVRHIQVESLAKAEQIIHMVRNGADFAELTREHSLNPSAGNGGLLPPFGRHTKEIPPALREVALSMSEPGELSETIRADTYYHVLYFVKSIPPQDIDYERVKEQLRVSVRRRLVENAKPILRGELISRADIEFVEPILKAQSSHSP